MHSACAQGKGVFVSVGSEGATFTPSKQGDQSDERGKMAREMMVCQDCSRLDPASLRLSLLRNGCSALDLLSIVDPSSASLKLTYLDNLQLLMELSPADVNEYNRTAISILVSLMKKGPEVITVRLI